MHAPPPLSCRPPHYPLQLFLNCTGFTCPAGTTIPKVPPPGGFTSPPNVTDCCTAVFNCSSVTCGAGTIKNETAGNFLSPPTQAQCCVPVYNCAANVCGTSGFPKNPQPVNSLTPVGFNECCNVSVRCGRQTAAASCTLLLAMAATSPASNCRASCWHALLTESSAALSSVVCVDTLHCVLPLQPFFNCSGITCPPGNTNLGFTNLTSPANASVCCKVRACVRCACSSGAVGAPVCGAARSGLPATHACPVTDACALPPPHTHTPLNRCSLMSLGRCQEPALAGGAPPAPSSSRRRSSHHQRSQVMPCAALR
jgi:hypothetical protein